MKGYWRKPEATAETITDGWFRTGDLAQVDEDGYFYIVDRKKDLIIRGGFNVYPREIEEVLHEHPAVAEVAVIGIPHPRSRRGGRRRRGAEAGRQRDTGELRAFAGTGLRRTSTRGTSGWWTLPKGPTGKILRREVQVQPGRLGDRQRASTTTGPGKSSRST